MTTKTEAEADYRAAEIEYDQWFADDRHPKVWRAVAVVFSCALDGEE